MHGTRNSPGHVPDLLSFSFKQSQMMCKIVTHILSQLTFTNQDILLEVDVFKTAVFQLLRIGDFNLQAPVWWFYIACSNHPRGTYFTGVQLAKTRLVYREKAGNSTLEFLPTDCLHHFQTNRSKWWHTCDQCVNLPHLAWQFSTTAEVPLAAGHARNGADTAAMATMSRSLALAHVT